MKCLLLRVLAQALRLERKPSLARSGFKKREIRSTRCSLASLLVAAAWLGTTEFLAGGEPAPPDAAARSKPTLFLIGDSTVRNSTRGQMGWGTPLPSWFDPQKIAVTNRALGGRSSRSFLTEGLWDKVLADIKPGDFVLMQFGHNDGGPLDEGRARASLKGLGDDSRVVTNKPSNKEETVRTYGWYMRRYIRDTKARGATPIVLSLIPRNIWKDGELTRAGGDYADWAAETAKQEGVAFVDLNGIISRQYKELGEERVKTFFPGDHTHTNPDGAALNARCVIEGLRGLTNAILDACILQAPRSDPPRKFSFGSGRPPPGFTHVPHDMHFSAEFGFGFEPGAVVREPPGETNGGAPAGCCTSDTPFLFSVALPEGNYDVTVTLGDPTTASSNTVKAESRRLMLERIVTAPGQVETRAFTVNIRTPNLPGGGHVRLKDREHGVLHWDEKLTLEFNGSRPALCSLELAPATNSVTVFLLGDSTVTDQPREPWNSWGQMLTRFFKPGVAVANHAESGESIKSSLGAHRVEKVLASLKPGDYVFAQFGHNDQKDRATNAVAVYKASLEKLIADVRARGATPVLVTSMERMAGTETNTLGRYPDTVRSIAREKGAALIDLQTMSRALYRALGTGLPKAFQDGTHHNAYGSYELAKCIVEGIRQNNFPLARFLVDGLPRFDPAHPDPVATFDVPPSPALSGLKPEGS